MTYRVAIIGGGAMGVSLLYHLAKAGWSDCVLLEKNDLTHGSTWHAAGLCTHFAHNATIQALRAHSVKLYRDVLPEETGLSTGFHPCGALRITRQLDRMDEFAHVAGLSRFTGHPLRLVTPDEIAELHPLARLDGIVGGIHESTDGHVDPTLATQAMAAGARERGAKIRRQCQVTAITRDSDRWRLITSTGGVDASHVVIAAGTWGFEVAQMLGLAPPMVPVLHQYLVTERIKAVAERETELPMIRDPDESWYVRQERDGLILGPYEKDAQIWSPDRVPPEFGADLLPPDLDRVEPIVEATMARIPALGEAGIKSVINGPITFTPDGNSLIGPAHGAKDVWMLTGSSMGIMEGGGAGWFLAHWMTQGAPPMDALAVDPRRFGKWADRDYRIEKAVECFGLQFGVHYPFEERPAARGKRLTPLHGKQTKSGAVFGAAYGWERPNHFGADSALTFRAPGWLDTVANETRTVTGRAGLGDLSAFAKFEVTGNVRAFLARLGANTPPREGRIGLTHALTPAGGVASEFSVAMLSENRALLCSAAAAEEHDDDLLRERSVGFDVEVRRTTGECGILAVMGPHARGVLAPLASDLDFPWLSVREIEVAGVRVTAWRVSYIGELGWELHAPMEALPRLWDALRDEGEPHGMGLFGAYAMNAMRLEKGYRAWGMDLTTERTPAEAGLGAFVKDHDFIGREAMLVRRNSGWRMVLLSLESGDPFYAHSVLRRGEPVGIVTSGARGHRTGQRLALAYLRHAADDDLSVEIIGEAHRAQVLSKVPFDPENARMRG